MATYNRANVIEYVIDSILISNEANPLYDINYFPVENGPFNGFDGRGLHI